MSATTKEALLESAETMLLEHGVQALTFDKLAARAGVSKGGVLHHFPNKDVLVEALVQRSLGDWQEELRAATAAQPEGPGRLLRGMIALTLDSEHWDDDKRRRCSVMTTAMVTDPEKVAPLRAFVAQMRLEAEAQEVLPGYADAIMMALDGIWLGWAFGVQEIDRQRIENLRSCLERVLEIGIVECRETRGVQP